MLFHDVLTSQFSTQATLKTRLTNCHMSFIPHFILITPLPPPHPMSVYQLPLGVTVSAASSSSCMKCLHLDISTLMASHTSTSGVRAPVDSTETASRWQHTHFTKKQYNLWTSWKFSYTFIQDCTVKVLSGTIFGLFIYILNYLHWSPKVSTMQKSMISQILIWSMHYPAQNNIQQQNEFLKQLTTNVFLIFLIVILLCWL